MRRVLLAVALLVPLTIRADQLGDRDGLIEGGMPPTGGTFSGDVNMGGNDIYNVLSISSDDAVPCYGDNYVLDADFVGGCSRDTDAAPQPFMIHPQDNYAAGAQTATNLRLRGGMDERTVVIGTAANCGSDTLVFTLSDGTTVTLTEGVDFTKVDGDNAATAAALLVPILLQTTLVDTTQTTRSSATLRLQHHRNSRTWTLSTNDVNGCFTLSNGTDGLVTFDGTIGGSLSTGPALVNVTGSTTVFNVRPDRSSNSGLSFASNVLRFGVGGSQFLEATATNMTVGSATDLTARGGLKSDVGTTNIEDVMGTDTTPTVVVGASATTFAISRNVQIVDCDAGGNTVATITGGDDGVVAHLIFVDASCTITDSDDGAADTVDLPANVTSAADLVLCIVHNGTSWLGCNSAGSANDP